MTQRTNLCTIASYRSNSYQYATADLYNVASQLAKVITIDTLPLRKDTHYIIIKLDQVASQLLLQM